ncbi:hypothetical protein PVAP13_2KG288034 [Panicum virgatum]|uniref:MULE transposase domain-containing protein n=1 Tax=Panicum virgatum TaxID=38727 RepID=A0A8T0W0W2_PANVG|nr:hypothetical protein PVAP13_2KG288034 [Panicum virgatum]
MGGKLPQAVFTDQCAATAAALKNVWKGVTHLLCKWHMFKDTSARLGPIYRKASPFFQQVKARARFSSRLSTAQWPTGDGLTSLLRCWPPHSRVLTPSPAAALSPSPPSPVSRSAAPVVFSSSGLRLRKSRVLPRAGVVRPLYLRSCHLKSPSNMLLLKLNIVIELISWWWLSGLKQSLMRTTVIVL